MSVKNSNQNMPKTHEVALGTTIPCQLTLPYTNNLFVTKR